MLSERPRRTWAVLAATAAVGLCSCGCTNVRLAWRRHTRPAYVATADFYREAPQRVVVLPFAPEPGETGRVDITERSAVACRDTFYRHFSVRPFHDVELHEVDRVVLQPPATARPKPGRALRLAKSVDVIGISSLLGLHELLKHSPWHAPKHWDDLDKIAKAFDADAYAIGATRNFGWFYAVLFSSVTVACKVEIRSCRSGTLLWSGEWKRRSIKHAIDTDVWVIPYHMVEVWRHTRGQTIETVADQTFRALVKTIPSAEGPREVFVQPTESPTHLYTKPSMHRWNRAGVAWPKGRLALVSRQPGWYHCLHPQLGKCWIFEDHAKLVDGNDDPIAE